MFKLGRKMLHRMKFLKKISSIIYNRGPLNVIECGVKCSKRNYIEYPNCLVKNTRDDD